MDFEIKRKALARWEALLPELLDGPLWRESEIDLKDSFSVLDDFIFLRALRNRCRVEWVEEPRDGRNLGMVGWCEWAEETNQGPTQWIRIVRPTAQKPKTVQDILCTLIHEMCHAIFAFKCKCVSCCCTLNMINGEGLDGHGPSWEKLRRAIEETANQHLKGFYEPIALCYPSEPQVESEKKKVGKMLSGLYKKITLQGSESAELKRLQRAKKATEEIEMLTDLGKVQAEEDRLESIACAGAMFRSFERETSFGAVDERVACAPAMMVEISARTGEAVFLN